MKWNIFVGVVMLFDTFSGLCLMTATGFVNGIRRQRARSRSREAGHLQSAVRTPAHSTLVAQS